VEEWNTSSGGMFSPRVRVSLANFLRFSVAVRTWCGREDVVVVVVVECMLKREDMGERDFELVTGVFDGFILAVACTGSDRS
jgi:hypothetical protein